VRREVKQARRLAVALAQLGLTPPFSVYLPRAAAGLEVLVRDDAALGLDDLTAHLLQPVMRALVWTPTTAQVCSMRHHTSLGVSAHGHVAPSPFEPDLIVSRFSRTTTTLL
jgi:hypothetical protein